MGPCCSKDLPTPRAKPRALAYSCTAASTGRHPHGERSFEAALPSVLVRGRLGMWVFHPWYYAGVRIWVEPQLGARLTRASLLLLLVMEPVGDLLKEKSKTEFSRQL